jgi:hypothetical protein
MADRLINENDALALIQARLETHERLLNNKYASQADRRVLASNIAVLRRVVEDLASVPDANMTEADMARVANDAAEPGALSCVG